MIDDVTKHCLPCATYRSFERKPLPLGDNYRPKQFGDALSFDLVGPYKANGPVILTVIDVWSRFAFAHVFQGRPTGDQIAEALLNIFIRNSMFPKIIFSDNGKELVSKIMQHFTKHWQIKQKQSLAWSPQTQGSVEVFHKILNRCLRTALHDLPTGLQNMKRATDIILNNYNCLPHGSTNCSPILLKENREQTLPSELVQWEKYLPTSSLSLIHI